MSNSTLDDLLDFPELINWESEANAIIHDVKEHVAEIAISTLLPSSRTHIFLNVETLEHKRMCVRVSGEGFRVVGDDFDHELPENQLTSDTFDTPYALLSHVSSEYTNSFGDCLTNALKKLTER